MTHTTISREAQSDRSALGRLSRPYNAIAKSRERRGNARIAGDALANVATVARGGEPQVLKLTTCHREGDI